MKNSYLYLLPGRRFTLFLLLFLALQQSTFAQQHSVARMWNEALLEAIRKDFARPPVHARNLFHISMAMYDAWAAYDDEAETFLLGKTLNGYTCAFNGVPPPADIQAAREMAISYAAYRLLTFRFQNSPGAATSQAIFNNLFAQLGYDPSFTSGDYSTGNPAALGNYIATCVALFGLQDGSNEQNNFVNQYYQPINPPMAPELPGSQGILNPNHWQPLTFDVFIDQSGNVIPGITPAFQSPEWGRVTPFSLKPEELNIYERDGDLYWVYHDPGPPPYLDIVDGGGYSEEYKWGFLLVALWSSQLDPNDGVMWDISPASIGNIQNLPEDIEGLRDFYNDFEGGDIGTGWPLNPRTGQPYEPQMVPRGDYARVLAEFWADGPNSETPPGHWFTILNYVNDQPELEKRFNGQGPVLDGLEWDVKSYVTLGGAMHDAAITAWGIKGWYDYTRPISAIRYMADLGQSSDPNLPSYHPGGVPLIPGYVELVQAGDPLAGFANVNVGKIKLYAWRGPDFIQNPATDDAGVGWILAENWWPYQRPTFVTPPFAGYISGHSTFSRAAAEVVTLLTGDPFFPGGLGEFHAPQNEFLVFEEGPSVDVTLQWATYRDASDQTSLSRIWGGIHPPADDIPGRRLGITLGVEAFHFAESYFYQDADMDGFYSFEDCDDSNPDVHPNAIEICDGIDNDCNGMADDDITIYTYYLDTDGDSFGDAATSLDTCLAAPPAGYVANDLDCNDGMAEINPDMIEVCDGIDNDCNGMADDGLQFTTYFLDLDGDGFGDAAIFLDTCLAAPPIGYVANSLDCNDGMAEINPDRIEVCDGIDNDCNGMADDGLQFTTYFLDLDGDSFGDAAIFLDTCLSAAPEGYVANNMDCDDINPDINPDAEEVLDSLDNNCNGMVDEGLVASQNPTDTQWNVFPNPTDGQLFIQGDFRGQAIFRVIDINGRVVKEQQISMQDKEVVLSLGAIPSGVYLLECQKKDGARLFVGRVLKI